MRCAAAAAAAVEANHGRETVLYSAPVALKMLRYPSWSIRRFGKKDSRWFSFLPSFLPCLSVVDHRRKSGEDDELYYGSGGVGEEENSDGRAVAIAL
jgi:hypothetical protein